MDWTIGKRIKSRNRLRLQEVNKRKKTEEGSPSLSSSHKKQKRTRPKDYDSDIEDITPANHKKKKKKKKKKKSPHVEESDKNLCNVKIVSEEDKSVPGSSGLTVKEKLYDLVVGLEAGQSIPNYSVFRNGLEQNTSEKDKLSSATSSSESRHGSEEDKSCEKEKCSSDNRGSDVWKSVSDDGVEIISDSDSETKEKVSAKKKLFEESSRDLEDSISVTKDDSSETEEEDSEDSNVKDDDVMVDSLSSSDDSSASFSSSSSSSSEDLRKARSPIRKVSNLGRKPLRRFTRSGSCSAMPIKEDKKIQKVNHREEEEVLSQTRPIKEDKKIQKLNHREEEDTSQIRPRKEDKKIQNLYHKEEEEDTSQIRPRKEEKKIQKVNRLEEEEGQEEVERVTKQQSNVVYICAHCGKENTGGVPDSRSSFIRPNDTTVSDNDVVDNFASSNVSKFEDSVSINTVKVLERSSTSRPEVKTPEKPSTSRPDVVDLEKPKEVQEPAKPSRSEIHNSEKAKEVQAPEKPSRIEIQISVKPKEVQAPEKPSRIETQAPEKAKDFQANITSGSRMPAVAVAVGLNKPALANEQVDNNDSASSIRSEDESEYESEPSPKEKEVKSNNKSDWRMMDGSSRKEVDLFRLLVNSVWEKDRLCEEEEGVEQGGDNQVSSRDDHYVEQDQRTHDDDGLLIIRTPALIDVYDVDKPQPPPLDSVWEREEQKLWEEFDFYSKSQDADILLPSNMEREVLTDESPKACCNKGNHELLLDIEIGLICKHCSFVETEVRNMDVSEWGDNNTSGRRKNDRFEGEKVKSSFIGELGFEAPTVNNNSNVGCESSEGTVWDKIPGVKSQMYPHQQEGFEFIWKNLAGTILLNELKDYENSDETGGCIMSHAPGTGKTRLTIIFLQAYLECFPDCKPVIIAPASLLLTWEEEFKKWNISVPFHNLSSLDFTGRESSVAVRLLMQKNSSARTNNEIRMVKIYSWIKAKSILGISYHLYEKLAGVKDDGKKTKKAKEVRPDKELKDIREILMGMPGLLVLDEAHTPRNQRSCIWKTLSKVETQKRILLSGTPFQNNFQELCNVLGLARPKYLERLTSTLKKSGMTVTKRGKRSHEINNRGIDELKVVMLPFVHVHKGSILQKSLPGLRECVVVLNPPELQKRVLESIEVTHNRKIKNVFETEHKLSLVSVHPSLVSRCKLTEKERLSIDDALLEQLKKIKLDPNQSVKTRFLMEFIRLCDVIHEKVLVFSQYIDPLKLIMKHMVSKFKWNEGVEVLYMHGKLEQKQRQTLINEFNDHKSKAKVLLASTKACSEGINLVGASRVILLDVVWNPAVERQAISRAYRIGQKKIVYTYHLVAKGTPEGPKYCKQAQKDRISELVFACSSRQEKGKEKIAETVAEDKVLDTMVQHLKLGDMFDNLIIQPKEADLVEGFNILMP